MTPDAKLRHWRFYSRGPKTRILAGQVFEGGKKRFRDGRWIMTTRVTRVFRRGDQRFAQTANTVYELVGPAATAAMHIEAQARQKAEDRKTEYPDAL